ncbi:hypothetical protein ACTG9Q_27190 [Actinokineospora sp. 24-640]
MTDKMGRRPALVAASTMCAAALWALVPIGVAEALPTGSVWVDGDTLTFRAATGTENRVRVSKAGTDLVVLDVVPMAPGTGCRTVTAYKIACAASTITGIDVDLGSLDDDFAISAPGLGGAVIGSTGNDFFSVEGDYFSGGRTSVVYLGGAGHDRISYALSPVGVEVSKGAGRGDGRRVSEIDPIGCHYTRDEWKTPVDGDDVRDDIEEIQGSDHGDIIEGSRSAYNGDHLAGGGGRDCLLGHDGNDRFLEGSGANGSDGLEGGKGYDTVDYSKRTLKVRGWFSNYPKNQYTGEVGESDAPYSIERLYGGSGPDNITFGMGPVEIHGGPGDDDLNVLGYYNANYGRFTDTNDRLFGGDGTDHLIGGGGDDHLDGGPAADILECGLGTDSAVRTPGDDLSRCETIS